MTVEQLPLIEGWSAYTWTGHDLGRGRNLAWTCDQLPQLLVRHCGHPTALRPYYIPCRFPELGTFHLLADAQRAAIADHLAHDGPPWGYE